MSPFSVVCLSNRADVLAHNLRASPDIASGRLPLHVEEHPESAAAGLNRALDGSVAEVLILAHQDVYLPRGWAALLERRLAALPSGWAVAAPFGIGADGRGWGPVWSTSIGQIVGHVPEVPVAIQSADELLMVIRRESGLRFDPELSGFHLYGTDIVQTARSRGLGAFTTPMPLVHNDAFKPVLDAGFADAYHFMRRKWRTELPVRTPILTLGWHGLHLHKAMREARKSREWRARMAQDCATDPAIYAERCGWADLSP